jgi:Glycosyl transferase family 2
MSPFVRALAVHPLLTARCQVAGSTCAQLLQAPPFPGFRRDSMEPLVSILINNYNYERFVGDAIESALAQSWARCEVVVVDDGSTDNSRDVIFRFGTRIQTIFQRNGGQASAFNTGFKHSRGDIICFLDSDDVFLPNKVAEVVAALDGHERQWHFHRLQWTDAALNPISMPPYDYETGDYDLRSASRQGNARLSAPSTSGLSFTRKLLEQIMPVPEAIKITSDNYIKYASLALAPGYCDRNELVLQRIHGANAYTLKGDDNLRGDILLKTAAGLRMHFPALRKTCSQMCAEGLALHWRSGLKSADLYREAREYLSGVTRVEVVEVFTRLGVKAARHCIRSVMTA